MIITITKAGEYTSVTIDTDAVGDDVVLEGDVPTTLAAPTVDEDGFRDLIDPKAVR